MGLAFGLNGGQGGMQYDEKEAPLANDPGRQQGTPSDMQTFPYRLYRGQISCQVTGTAAALTSSHTRSGAQTKLACKGRSASLAVPQPLGYQCLIRRAPMRRARPSAANGGREANGA